MYQNQIWQIAIVGLSIVAAFAAYGCGGDDDSDEDEIAAVEAVVKEVAESDASNAEYVFAHVTDRFLEALYFASRDECMAIPDECLGEPAVVESFADTEVNGDTATTVATLDFGTLEIGLVKEDGAWLLDTGGAASDDVPEGAATIELALNEFSFGLDRESIPAGGNFAFRAHNAGKQAHEVVVVRVPEGSSAEEAVGAVAEEEAPPVGFKVFIQPGQTVDMAFDTPLEAGSYVLVCFFPDVNDPEFTSHIEKGMVTEFVVH
ncbi:MAG: hypothetical protein R3C29_00950 [Dehalococcoidia bacterium]|nr:hypothetical protein [Dehalococcoidia bacterium]